MRNAWNVRLAGFPPVRRVAAGTLARTRSTNRAEFRNGSRSRSRTTAEAIRGANFSSPQVRSRRVNSLCE